MSALLEYQVKQLLAAEGVPVPEGLMVKTSVSAVPQVPWARVAVKAQTAVSSRARKGLVRLCGAGRLRAAVRSVRSAVRRSGVDAPHLLLEEALEARREYYLSIVSDPVSRGPCLLFARSGGVDIESPTRRAKIERVPLPVLEAPSRAKWIAFFGRKAGLPPGVKPALADAAAALYRLYRKWHCRMIEVNPLALCGERLVALDGKARLDEDALPVVGPLLREAGLTLPGETGTRLERAAAKIDAGDYRGSAHFVENDPVRARERLGGRLRAFVGFNGIGTGASLTAMDELVRLGFFPRNFCDTSGNPPASKLYRATRIILAQPGLGGYFFISCVSSQQLHHTARGILKAFQETFPATGGEPPYPAVLVFRGAWDEEALELLREHGWGDRPHVAILGRETTEREAAARFAALYEAHHAKTKRR